MSVKLSVSCCVDGTLPRYQLKGRGREGGRCVQADRWAGNQQRYPQTLPSRKSFMSTRPERRRCEMRRAKSRACSWHPCRWNDSAPSPTLLKGRWTSTKEKKKQPKTERMKKMGAEDEDVRFSGARRIQVTDGRGSSLSTYVSGGVEGWRRGG